MYAVVGAILVHSLRMGIHPPMVTASPCKSCSASGVSAETYGIVAGGVQGRLVCWSVTLGMSTLQSTQPGCENLFVAQTTSTLHDETARAC